MKIIELCVENVKRLKAIQIFPGDRSTVVITGANGVGKSSVLDSIMCAIGGAKNIPDVPLRKGEKKGKIKLDLGDMVVERTFTEAGGGVLTVESKGLLSVFKKPQAMLNKLFNGLSFDPTEFIRQDKRAQFDTLQSMVTLDVDIDTLNGQRAFAESQRADTNRDVKRLRVKRDESNLDDCDVVPVRVDTAELMKELDAGREYNEENKRFGDYLKVKLDQIIEINKKIKDLSAEKSDVEEAVRKAQDEVTSRVDKDVDSIRAKIANAGETNRLAAMYDDHERVKAEHEKAVALSGTLTDKMKAIDKRKADALESATFPVDGLSFGDGEVTYNGLPLDQASSAEQLRVSLAIAMAANPELKVILITDGSLLDSKSMEIIEEMAGSGGYQVWVEVVDETGKVGIVIEDGSVQVDNG